MVHLVVVDNGVPESPEPFAKAKAQPPHTAPLPYAVSCSNCRKRVMATQS